MKKILKWGGIIFVVLLVIGALSDDGDSTTSVQSETSPTTISEEIIESDNKTKTSPNITPDALETNDFVQVSPETSAMDETTNETLAQKNVVRKAQSYLDYSAFSEDGLVKQLEFEKFSHEDAVYGAANVKANWNEQAEKKAKSYLEYTAFSRDGLIQQLEFEGFTTAQATYGVNAIGL